MKRVHDERGSVSTWMVLTVVAFMLIVGLTVDLGGRLHSLQRVTDVAAEAARVGAQQVEAGDALRGQPLQVDTGRAKQAAIAYVQAAGYTGTATLTRGDVLRVRVTGSHTPVFLGVVGVGPLQLTGEADARLVPAQNGHER